MSASSPKKNKESMTIAELREYAARKHRIKNLPKEMLSITELRERASRKRASSVARKSPESNKRTRPQGSPPRTSPPKRVSPIRSPPKRISPVRSPPKTASSSSSFSSQALPANFDFPVLTETVFQYPDMTPTSFLDHVSFISQGDCLLKDLFSRIYAETESPEYLDIVSKSTMVMYGKTIPIKARKQVSYGAYSHFTGANPKLVLPPFSAVQELMDLANAHMHANYPETRRYKLNSVVLNRYDNGDNYIGHHADGTVTLYPDSPIYSFSFGATRVFEVAERKTKKVLLAVPIEDCHCYIMRGRFQTDLTHAVPQIKPKSVALKVPFRINVTFRCVDLAKADAKIKGLHK